MHAMPTTFLPYVTAMRNVFLDGGDTYQGDAQAAVNAGFLNGADISEAKHGVYYAWSPYRDAMRKYKDGNRLARASKDTKEIAEGVHLGKQALVFDEISRIAGSGDYREFASILDRALKQWGVMPKDTGLVDGKLISDTGEIIFEPDRAKFRIRTPYCGYFSGAPDKEIALSENVTVHSENERITLALLPVGEETLEKAEEFVLTAMGTTGMDETVYGKGPEMMGIPFAAVKFKGKLYAETLEGSLLVKAEEASLKALSPVGEEIGEIQGEKSEDGICFRMTGELPGIQYHLMIKG